MPRTTASWSLPNQSILEIQNLPRLRYKPKKAWYAYRHGYRVHAWTLILPLAGRILRARWSDLDQTDREVMLADAASDLYRLLGRPRKIFQTLGGFKAYLLACLDRMLLSSFARLHPKTPEGPHIPPRRSQPDGSIRSLIDRLELEDLLELVQRRVLARVRHPLHPQAVAYAMRKLMRGQDPDPFKLWNLYQLDARFVIDWTRVRLRLELSDTRSRFRSFFGEKSPVEFVFAPDLGSSAEEVD